jgi:hypothetical protein
VTAAIDTQAASTRVVFLGQGQFRAESPSARRAKTAAAEAKAANVTKDLARNLMDEMFVKCVGAPGRPSSADERKAARTEERKAAREARKAARKAELKKDPTLRKIAAEVEAAVLGMDGLELEGADGTPLKLKPVNCYRPPADRIARLASVDAAHGLTMENTVAVTCTVEGKLTADGFQVVETVVAASEVGSPPRHCVFIDPIALSDTSIAALVEAQFEEGGAWTLGRGTAYSIAEEKAVLFGHYEKAVSEENPECLATLRRMLQAGPLTRVYTGGGRPPHVGSHEGFSLRMPPEELPQWQTLGDKGDLQDVRRPAHARS